MFNAVASHQQDWANVETGSLDASDDFETPDAARYCPSSLLATFTLLMAQQGRCINDALMLSDREYAMWQLARAHAMGGSELRGVAVRLFAYFDDARAPARTAH